MLSQFRLDLALSARFLSPTSTTMAATSDTSQAELEAVRYLRQKGPGALQSDFKLSSKQHSKHQNLWLFKYHQTQSDFDVRPPLALYHHNRTSSNLSPY